MDDRIKDIQNIIEIFKPQDEYKKSLDTKITLWKEKYKTQLDKYKFVKDLKELKPGGYIRYIDFKENLKLGGMFLKIIKNKNNFNEEVSNLLLRNSSNKLWNISWENNYIFYKKQVIKGDNIRDLFISLLDK